MNFRFTAPVAWAIVVFLLVALVALFQPPGERMMLAQRSYSQLVGMGPNLKSALIRGDELVGRDETGTRFTVRLPRDVAFADRLARSGTDVVIGEPAADKDWLMTLVTNGAPLVLYAIIWLYPLLRVARALERLLADQTRSSRAAMDAAPPSA